MSNSIVKEIWKPYPPIGWVYGSNLGNIKTVDHCTKSKNGREYHVKGHDLPQCQDRGGYMLVHVSVNGKTVALRAHRIIATCFLENPDNLPEVNHLDCNPMNNCVNNLEWCTHQENIAYRDKLGHTNYKNNILKSPVIVINLETQEASRFKSQMEASRGLGVYQSNINNVLKGKYSQTGGFWFCHDNSNAVEVTRERFGNGVANKVKTLMEGK